MHRFFSVIAPVRRKRPTRVHTGRSQLHDNNDDILRIIKLYNQGVMKPSSHDDSMSNSKKYPVLLKYRTSNVYIFFVAALSIFSSVYMNYISSSIKPHIQEHQVVNRSALDSEDIQHMYSYYNFLGLLGGSLIAGWLGCTIKQRKGPILMSTFVSLLTCSLSLAAGENRVLLPSGFLQGVSNAFVWIFSVAMVSDACSPSRWDIMMGLVAGVFPASLMIGLNIGVIIFKTGEYNYDIYSAFVLCLIVFFAHVVVLERATLPEDWKIHAAIGLGYDADMGPQVYRDMQRDTIDVVDRSSWSKSSSMTTINFRDQPIIFKNQKDHGIVRATKDYIRNSIVLRMITTVSIMTQFYLLIVVSSVIGLLKCVLIQHLELQLNIREPTHQTVIVCTFLFPFSVSLFSSGWFCSLFGVKTVSLTSILVCIPAFVWVGVPHQKLQFFVSALTLCGFSVGGMTMGVLISCTRAVQQIQLRDQYDLTLQQEQALNKEQSTCAFAVVSSLFTIGFLLSGFISEFCKSVRFLWVCFSFSLLLATCIPLIACLWKSKRIEKSHIISNFTNNRTVVLHNTRSACFDEHISDDESTVGSSSNSEYNVKLESKSLSTV